jgi:hypothetical protein
MTQRPGGSSFPDRDEIAFSELPRVVVARAQVDDPGCAAVLKLTRALLDRAAEQWVEPTEIGHNCHAPEPEPQTKTV